jgi:(R,R)-butanediol dehydrogenase/meso-butanediol dehydrogenase/diacetyl reductase
MKAIVWLSPGEIDLIEVPKPKAKLGWAVVKTSFGGICGSDITIKNGKHPRAKAPLILGHELAGTIEEIEPNSRLAIGDRVVLEPLLSCGKCQPCLHGHDHVCENLKLLGVEADGGFAEYFLAPINRLYKISDKVNDQESSLAEPLAVAVHSVNYANPKKEDNAVIIGAGPIGLLIGLVLKARGIKSVWVSEIDSHRLELAKQLGLGTINPLEVDPVEQVLKLTNGKGSNLTFDAAGFPAVGMQIVPMTAIKGKVIMAALHKQPCEVFFRDLSYKEILIQGVRIYAKGDFAEAVTLLEEGKVDVKPLISHQFKKEDFKKAFDAAQKASESCKVIIGF